MITTEDVEDVATLARLELTEDEKALFTKQLNQILEYFDLLNEVNTEGIDPIAHPIPFPNVLRDDIQENNYDRSKLLQIVPEEENGYIKVPKILED